MPLERVIARWPTVVWVAVALLSPAAAGWIGPSLRRTLPKWVPYLHSLAPWLHGIGPAYLALITGTISGRYFGLMGQPALAWAGDLLFCALWIVASSVLVQPLGQWPKPARGVLDEPRWSLYRAAGAAWIGNPPMGALIGLALAAAELGVQLAIGRGPRRLAWESLARAASSALVFVVTANFWLTLVTQGLALYQLRGRRL